MVAFINPKELIIDKKWPLLLGLNVATLITLCTLFYYNIANFFAGDNDENRGRWRNENGEWDPDFKQEEREAFKIVLCLLILIVGCVSLIIPAIFVWHPTKGCISKVPVGTLSAILFMFGQMLFISYWYLSDFERVEEEGNRYLKNNNDDNNKNDQNQNYDYQEMSEEERLAYYQKVTRNFMIVMALLYLITSVYVYEWGKKGLPSTVASLTPEKTGHIGIFRDVWRFASYLSIGIMSIQTLRVFIWLFGERGERMREEGLIYNTFMVVLWSLMLTGITFFASYKAMVKKEWTDAVGVGALGGCYMGLGLTFFMVFLLYCFASLDDKMEQEMPISVSISACAFFLFTLNIFLGWLTLKYSDSILADISENKGEACSDYHTMEKPSFTSQLAPQYTKPSVPARQFSAKEYVKEFNEEDGTLPTGVDC